MAIGVAARCDGCIAFHTHDALDGSIATEAVEPVTAKGFPDPVPAYVVVL